MTLSRRPRSKLIPGLFIALSMTAAITAMAGGCRGVLGIEERELDSTLADAGSDGDGGTADPLSCEAYCTLIQGACLDNNAQYGSIETCMGFCSTLELGALDDDSGDTVGCRINTIKSSAGMIELSDCAAGGPGGNGVCGSNCESFCKSMVILCPDTYASEQACADECADLITCGNYHVVPNTTPDDPSVQCRLYHISAASAGIASPPDTEPTVNQSKHCPHASGQTECIAVADPTCPE